MAEPYGYELILDLHGCDVTKFIRESIRDFFDTLCEAIDMQQEVRYFWDDLDTPKGERQTSPHTTGVSAVQFILTSSIVIHTLTLRGSAYVNIFSCKTFDSTVAKRIAEDWFKAADCNAQLIERT